MPTNSHPSLPASSSASRSLDFAGTLLRSILLYSHWGIVSLLAAAVRLDRQDQGGGAPRSEIERLAQALNAGPPLGEPAEALTIASALAALARAKAGRGTQGVGAMARPSPPSSGVGMSLRSLIGAGPHAHAALKTPTVKPNCRMWSHALAGARTAAAAPLRDALWRARRTGPTLGRRPTCVAKASSMTKKQLPWRRWESGREAETAATS